MHSGSFMERNLPAPLDRSCFARNVPNFFSLTFQSHPKEVFIIKVIIYCLGIVGLQPAKSKQEASWSLCVWSDNITICLFFSKITKKQHPILPHLYPFVFPLLRHIHGSFLLLQFQLQFPCVSRWFRKRGYTEDIPVNNRWTESKPQRISKL